MKRVVVGSAAVAAAGVDAFETETLSFDVDMVPALDVVRQLVAGIGRSAQPVASVQVAAETVVVVVVVVVVAAAAAAAAAAEFVGTDYNQLGIASPVGR